MMVGLDLQQSRCREATYELSGGHPRSKTHNPRMAANQGDLLGSIVYEVKVSLVQGQGSADVQGSYTGPGFWRILESRKVQGCVVAGVFAMWKWNAKTKTSQGKRGKLPQESMPVAMVAGGCIGRDERGRPGRASASSEDPERPETHASSLWSKRGSRPRQQYMADD